MTDIRSALLELLGTSHPLDEALDRHFNPGYRQRTNGVWDDRAGFAQHVEHLRAVVADVEVTVLDELVDGDRYGDRHVVTVHKRDGGTVVQEVYVFARRDEENRFLTLEEVTLMLEGAEADRHLGSAT